MEKQKKQLTRLENLLRARAGWLPGPAGFGVAIGPSGFGEMISKMSSYVRLSIHFTNLAYSLKSPFTSHVVKCPSPNVSVHPVVPLDALPSLAVRRLDGTLAELELLPLFGVQKLSIGSEEAQGIQRLTPKLRQLLLELWERHISL